MASAIANLIVIGGIVYVAYYLYTQTDVFSQLQALLKGDGGGSGAPQSQQQGMSPSMGNVNAGAGGLIYPGTGKSWVLKDGGHRKTNYRSGGSSPTRRWFARGVGAVKNLETTARVKFGSCKDTISIKHYGPNHNNKNCCWIILNVDINGNFFLGGEGPHPSTSKDNIGKGQSSMGSIANKTVEVKFITYYVGNTIHAEGYGRVTGGGQWKKCLAHTATQFGRNKKSSTPHSNSEIQVRVDCNVDIESATAAEINPAGGGGTRAAALALKKSYYTGNMLYPQQSYYNRRYSQKAYNKLPYI